ncbi:outer membrane protein [Novosphingobium sp. PhB165]|uniref:TolC family protein n=1 Tax=Novosphingobium sp. PhB165 TaxID=2485105 RepID=UPI001049AB68|nr:TolC family protein [Novosphingobium sp. PhB165]TCM18000.1 outer membrane protein [Novosphingobium sp. PhB165]
MAMRSILLACTVGLASCWAITPLSAQPNPARVPRSTDIKPGEAMPDAVREAMAASAARPPLVPASMAVEAATIPAPTTGGAYPAPTFRPDGRAASAVPAQITSLGAAIALAYATNPQLLSARAEARSSDYGYAQARSAFGPTLTASANYAFTRIRQETANGPFIGAQGWASGADLVLSQPIWNSGRLAAGQEAALATSQYRRAALRVTEAQVIGNVVSAYVSVRRDAQAVTIARENLKLLEQQLEENNTRFGVRDLTLTELDQTRTRLELGRAQLLQAEGQLGLSQKQFLQYVGAPPGELTPPDVLDIRFASLEDAYAYAEVNSGVVGAARAKERISRAQAVAERAEYGPTVAVEGSFEYASLSPFNDNLRSTEVIGQVVVRQTLFDSGLRHARTRAAQESNQADWRLVDSAYRDTREAIGSSWDQLASLRSALVKYQLAITAAEGAYQGALVQQKTGDLNTLDVLDLARDLLTLRTSYNATQADELIARANLLAAAGLLEGPKLVAGIDPYDADAHFERVHDAGDVPLITPILAGLDSFTNGDLRRDRALRDAAAQAALPATMPMPPQP